MMFASQNALKPKQSGHQSLDSGLYVCCYNELFTYCSQEPLDWIYDRQISDFTTESDLGIFMKKGGMSFYKDIFKTHKLL